LSGEQADFNRTIARWRWIVEAANERLKNFRYFHERRSWREIPTLLPWMRVACFLFNRWNKPILKLDRDDQ
jgi:hypothetical protein